MASQTPHSSQSDALLAQPLSVDGLQLRNRVLLAPMAGITDAAFRRQAWSFGAGYVVGEMLGARPDLWHTRKSIARRERVEGTALAIQLAGNDVETLAEAARRHVEDGADHIDINFGCPAKKVCRKAAGSALLAEPDRVVELTAAVIGAVDVPVTVKMRTGPCPETRNAVEIARRLEQLGLTALTLHGRTRACRFEGAVEYDTIAAVKAAVRLPVIANGDITCRADAETVLERTGADAVMIGRAALGAPWLPGVIAGHAEPSVIRKASSLQALVADVHALYGERAGVRIARKHVQWGLEQLGLSGDQVRPLLKIDSCAEQLDRLAELLDAVVARAA